jgi:hypothetical protein
MNANTGLADLSDTIDTEDVTDAERSDSNLAPGSIVSRINGRKVRTIEECAEALEHPIHREAGGYLHIVTKNGRSDGASMERIMELEPLLAKEYGFPLSDIYRAFAGSRKHSPKKMKRKK